MTRTPTTAAARSLPSPADRDKREPQRRQDAKARKVFFFDSSGVFAPFVASCDCSSSARDLSGSTSIATMTRTPTTARARSLPWPAVRDKREPQRRAKIMHKNLRISARPTLGRRRWCGEREKTARRKEIPKESEKNLCEPLRLCAFAVNERKPQDAKTCQRNQRKTFASLGVFAPLR